MNMSTVIKFGSNYWDV